ncbi:MAG: insulinase family protein [Bacteroidota bacterium]
MYESKPGISHFTSNMLEKGTERLNSSELAEMFDRMGAHIEISAGYDHTAVSVYALRKNWKEATELFFRDDQDTSIRRRRAGVDEEYFSPEP